MRVPVSTFERQEIGSRGPNIHRGLVQCGSSSGNVRACCVCSIYPGYYCCEREYLTAAETLLLNVFRGVEGAKDRRLMNSPSNSTLVYMAMHIFR